MSSTLRAALIPVYLLVTWNTVPKDPLEIFLWIEQSLRSSMSQFTMADTDCPSMEFRIQNYQQKLGIKNNLYEIKQLEERKGGKVGQGYWINQKLYGQVFVGGSNKIQQQSIGQRMDELDEMQSLLENKIIEISELKKVLQAEIESLEHKPRHLGLVRDNIQALIVIVKDFRGLFEQAKGFFKFQTFAQVLQDICGQPSHGGGKEEERVRQELGKTKFELEQQIKLNNLTKQEVLDLKEMINLHIEKSKKEIDLRDSIIKDLESRIQQHQGPEKEDKREKEEYIIKLEHLQTINEQEEMNFTSRVFNYEETNNFKLVKNHNIPDISEEPEPHTLSVMEREISSKRTTESKTRIRFFIDDFRNGVENTNQSIDEHPTSFTRERYSNVENQSESGDAISMFEFGRMVSNQRHTTSVQDKQNRDKTDRVSVDFSASESRQARSRSKQRKIELTHINKTPQLKVKDPNIMSGSKQRGGCSRFDRKERDSEKKMRVVSIERKKNYAQSRNTAKWMIDSLEKVDIYVGDKRTEQSYQGETRGKVREGLGKLEYINGLVYEGQFRDNTRHGQGSLSLNGTLIYQGQWCRDKLCGKGVIYNIHLVNKRKISQTNFLRSKSYYCGEFRENTFHGMGIWIINSCQRFQSLFRDGLPEGEFKYKNKFGDVEIGNSSWCADK